MAQADHATSSLQKRTAFWSLFLGRPSSRHDHLDALDGLAVIAATNEPLLSPINIDRVYAGAPARLLLNIDVPDLAAAEAFYVAAFGLNPARRLGDGVVELVDEL